MDNAKFITRAAKALGDRHRLNILQEIAKQGSITITEAIALSNLAQPSVSHHVKLLTDSELIDANKNGRTVHLSINKAKMEEFAAWFEEEVTEKGERSRG